MTRRARLVPAAVVLVLACGCRSREQAEVPPASQPAPPATRPAGDPMLSVNTLLPAPEDYARLRIGTADYPIPPYAKFLEGVRICLNPGHGGDAHKRAFKRGPTGVREAEINLRVARYLRDCLVAAGADVLMTREADIALSYAQRAAIANEWPADLFVSLHHNAIGNKPQVNYTTVWYHGSVDEHPASLDLARYLCWGLYDALAVEQITDVPVKSDQLMYKNGFAVLRHARVTAALCETSFYTNPQEEQRLRDPEYNLREAWGLFIGLAKYAAAGLPRARLIDPADGVVPTTGRSGPPPLVFELDDGLRRRKAWGHERRMILTDSISAQVDGVAVEAVLHDDGKRYLLEVHPPAELAPGAHALRLHFENMMKNSVLGPNFVFELR